MNFGTVAQRKPCAICRELIDFSEPKSECDRYTMHKSCFKCAICDVQLAPGSCSRDDGLINFQFMVNHKQGSPIWFCSNHMMLGSGEKYQLLKQKYAGGK